MVFRTVFNVVLNISKPLIRVCLESDIHGVSIRQTHRLVSIIQTEGIYNVKHTSRRDFNIQENSIYAI